MKKKQVFIAYILIVVLLSAACGSSPSPVSRLAADAEGIPDAPRQESSVWQAEYVPLETELSLSELRNGTAGSDGSLYFTSSCVLADETPEGVVPEWPEQYLTYGPVIIKVGTDGQAELLPYRPEAPDVPPGGNSGVLFEQLCAGGDGSLWVLEARYRTGERDPEERTLVHLREDGSLIGKISLDPLADFGEDASDGGTWSLTVSGLAPDGKGRLCVGVHEWFAGHGSYLQSNRICVLDDGTGALLHTIEFDGEIAGPVRLADGAVAAAYYEGSSPVFCLVDPGEGSFTPVSGFGDFLSCLTGGADEGTLLFAAGGSLRSLDTATGEISRLLDWTACDVAYRDGQSVCTLPDGRIVTTSVSESSEGPRTELVVLRQVPATETVQKTAIRVAVMNLYPFTAETISRFNRSSSEFRLEVIDYSQYNDYTSDDPEDWNAGLLRLQTELISGNAPDIIDVSLLPVGQFGEKGILEDLTPYIAADPELNSGQLNEHVLRSFEIDGRLYQTVSNFYVLTTAGLSRSVGAQMGWTMQDFSTAMQRLREEQPGATVFDPYVTRDDVLTFLLYLELENYVDWNTGECRFETDAFRDLLLFVKSFPEAASFGSEYLYQDADERLLAGLQLMKQCSLARFEDVQTVSAGLGGEACTFVGYPTEHGTGSMFAQIGNSFAISSGSAHKTAAWSFLREFFLPVYQRQFIGNVFPTNLSVYEQMKREAQAVAYRRNPDGSFALDENGRRIEDDHGSFSSGGLTLKLRAAARDEVELVEQIIAGTTHVLGTDSSLKSIIDSAAAGFFADQRSVEETMRQIQSRASLYISEQR